MPMITPFMSKRLVFRPLSMDDATDLFKLDSDPRVMRYLGNQPLDNINQVFRYLENIMAQYHEHGIGRWALVERNSGKFIGWSGLKFITEETNGFTNFYDLGYRLLPEYWGYGFATESASASVGHVASAMQESYLYASVHVENFASRAVLMKVGFEISSTYDFCLNNIPLPCYWLERKMD